MNDAQGGRVERRKQQTRQALTQMALELFCEKGIYWTKIEDITEKADVGKGTFYQYFKAKEDLLRALLSDGLQALFDRTEAAIKPSKHGPEVLGAAVRAHLGFFFDHREYLLLFHQIRGLLQLKFGPMEDLGRVYEHFFDQLGDLLHESLASSERSKEEIRELGIIVSTMSTGLLTHYWLFGRNRSWGANRDEVEDHVLRSIEAFWRAGGEDINEGDNVAADRPRKTAAD